MRRLPPLNALKAFEAAGRHLSFTRAADELFVTQAAISHQIKALEEFLGVSLFRRQNRNLLLIDIGQAYLPPLSNAFDTIDTATQRLQRQDQAGILNISVLGSFAAKWLVPRLGHFTDLHPDITVRILADDKIVDFNQEEIDLAIRYSRIPDSNLHSEKFMTEEFFVVCSPRLLTGATPLNTPKDLCHHTLLHDQMREDWQMWLDHAGVKVEPRRSVGFSHSNMVLDAAVDGLGVALGRSILVADDIAAGRLIKPFDISLRAEFAYFLVCPQSHVQRHKVKVFRDWVFERIAYDAARARLTAEPNSAA